MASKGVALDVSLAYFSSSRRSSSDGEGALGHLPILHYF